MRSEGLVLAPAGLGGAFALTFGVPRGPLDSRVSLAGGPSLGAGAGGLPCGAGKDVRWAKIPCENESGPRDGGGGGGSGPPLGMPCEGGRL